MRTQAQIIADCEARFAEIEAQAERIRERNESAEVQYPCKTCKFGGGSGIFCYEPLVAGHDKRGWVHSWDWHKKHERPKLCGPEKALWQPRPTIWQAIINIISGSNNG